MLKEISLRAAAAPAAILLAAFLAFGFTFNVGFMWDDHRMIEQNPRLSMTAANLAAAFKGDPFAQGQNYYRPLLTVSNMADFSLWGYRPFGFHLVNFAFLAGTAILFFYLALALGFGRPAAFWASVLLAAHPAAAEQMLIIAGRAELASSACLLASLLLFLKSRPALSFVFFLAAAGFKESGIIMPALAALCLWHLKREKKYYLKLLPFFIFIPVYFFIRHEALGVGALSKGWLPVLSGLFLKVPQAVLVYLKEAVLPFDMHSHRLQPEYAPLRYAALPALAAAAFLIGKKGGRTLVFCAAWYLLNLAPKFPLLAVNDLMLDHWVYLANAGLFLWAADRLAPRAGLRPLLPLAAAVLVLASVFNIPKRSTDLKIYEHAALRSSSKPMLYNLAREYYLAGRALKSRALMERIAAEEPGNALYLNGLGLARWKTGEIAGALAALEAALALKPGDPETLFNRYSVLAGAGRNKEAAAAIKELVGANPGYAPALLVLARSYSAAGGLAEAEVIYGKILKEDPANTEALNDYGVLLARRGNYPAAGGLFSRALRLSPRLESARQNLERLEKLKAAPRP
ncbi:MAG: tetratricopeptide repeat protein [Elusimicrobiota bacterium]|nr:tetratricopeptide repeat protein [Elusimicrobiota bacterium]